MASCPLHKALKKAECAVCLFVENRELKEKLAAATRGAAFYKDEIKRLKIEIRLLTARSAEGFKE